MPDNLLAHVPDYDDEESVYPADAGEPMLETCLVVIVDSLEVGGERESRRDGAKGSEAENSAGPHFDE